MNPELLEILKELTPYIILSNAILPTIIEILILIIALLAIILLIKKIIKK